jgi:hypothetical protein
MLDDEPLSTPLSMPLCEEKVEIDECHDAFDIIEHDLVESEVEFFVIECVLDADLFTFIENYCISEALATLSCKSIDVKSCDDELESMGIDPKCLNLVCDNDIFDGDMLYESLFASKSSHEHVHESVVLPPSVDLYTQSPFTSQWEDPFVMSSFTVPRKVLYIHEFHQFYDFSKAFDKLLRALMFVYVLLRVCSYHHHSEMHERMHDLLLRALNGSDMMPDILR